MPRRPRQQPIGAGAGVGGLAGVGVVVGVVLVEQVRDEVFGDAGVPGVTRGDRGGGDDLGVGVDADMPLVAVEAARGGLVPVPGLRDPRWRSPGPSATRRAIRNTPSSSCSRSWPSTVASNAAAWAHRVGAAHGRPGRASSAMPSAPARRPARPGRRGRRSHTPACPRDVVVLTRQHRPQLAAPARCPRRAAHPGSPSGPG